MSPGFLLCRSGPHRACSCRPADRAPAGRCHPGSPRTRTAEHTSITHQVAHRSPLHNYRAQLTPDQRIFKVNGRPWEFGSVAARYRRA